MRSVCGVRIDSENSKILQILIPTKEDKKYRNKDAQDERINRMRSLCGVRLDSVNSKILQILIPTQGGQKVPE